MTERIKLYLKSEPVFNEYNVAVGVYQEWVTAEGEIISPITCDNCKEGMYEGHVVSLEGEDEKHYCSPCMEEKYTAIEREEMYENDEQYYTVWDESDIDDTKYELVGDR